MMGAVYRYTVYAPDGQLLSNNLTARQIADLIGVTRAHVNASARRGDRLHGYTIIRNEGERELSKSATIETARALEDWDRTVAPLRKIQWVKTPGEGVRVLGGGA